ncbi:ParB N-terminal domain-containing protein [Chryseobacterium sp.]|uniref:ParB N-terminal domain-containing protein n=1 Tax=Chryseobacterium sp. TaxID=1871047 RepID=UPI003219D805
MKAKKVNISEVKVNPNNPRLIKDDKFKKLVKSIILFPQMVSIRPIIVDENYIALGGNMRYKGCVEIQKLGKKYAENTLKEAGYNENKVESLIELLSPIFSGFFPEGWVRQEINLSEDEKNEFIIKDNVSGGEWDWDLLANEWDADLLEDWGLDLKLPVEPGEDEEPEEQTYIPTFRFEVTCTTEKEKNKLMAELLTKGYSCTEDY